MSSVNKLGRPALPLDEQCSNRIAVYVNDADNDLLTALARKKRIAKAVLVREILVNRLESALGAGHSVDKTSQQ
jgi:hypothetical protein